MILLFHTPVLIIEVNISYVLLSVLQTVLSNPEYKYVSCLLSFLKTCHFLQYKRLFISLNNSEVHYCQYKNFLN